MFKTNNITLSNDQVKTIIKYLNNNKGYLAQITPDEFSSILGINYIEKALCKRSFWERLTKSEKWLTSWQLKTVKKNGVIKFEQIIEL